MIELPLAFRIGLFSWGRRPGGQTYHGELRRYVVCFEDALRKLVETTTTDIKNIVFLRNPRSLHLHGLVSEIPSRSSRADEARVQQQLHGRKSCFACNWMSTMKGGFSSLRLSAKRSDEPLYNARPVKPNMSPADARLTSSSSLVRTTRGLKICRRR